MVPSIGTVSSASRIASTAAWSDLWRSPWPMVWAQAIAACSTTRRNSRERSESIQPRLSPVRRDDAVRGQFAAGRTIGPVPEQVIGLHDFVNLAGTFVDNGAFAIPVKAADRVFIGVAVRAVNLHGVAGGALRRHRGEPLCQAGLAGVAESLVLHPAGSKPQQAGRLIIRLHLRDHFFHELMLADLDAERLPLLRVFHARVTAGPDQAGRARRDRETSLIQREHRDLESLAGSAHHVLGGHF